jgi:methyl-accepting chemotaxis protein
MVKQLRTLISEILNASTQLTGASQELLDNSEVASGQNQEQLSKIQEVAVSLREMATTIQDIAKNSEGAAAAAQQAGHQVVRGADLVRQVGGSINGLKNQMDTAVAAATCLEQNGKDITGILDVIRDIADQTSLLALNASIEAARAGEHGRGFAVVADEVRSLANRTQQSTKEIHHLIETLKGGMEQVVQLMQAGHESTANTVAQVYDAEAALSEIKQAATEIVDLNVQIASAIEQQSVVTAGINQYVSDIEKGSQVANQQTLSLMQAGKNLDDLATNLTSRVEHFRL